MALVETLELSRPCQEDKPKFTVAGLQVNLSTRSRLLNNLATTCHVQHDACSNTARYKPILTRPFEHILVGQLWNSDPCLFEWLMEIPKDFSLTVLASLPSRHHASPDFSS